MEFTNRNYKINFIIAMILFYDNSYNNKSEIIFIFIL